MSKPLKLALFSVVCAVAVLGFIYWNGGRPLSGQQGHIATRGPYALVIANESDINRASSAPLTDLQTMINDGRVYQVPNGTRIAVLDIGRFYLIRILDGAHAGKTGYAAPSDLQR